MAKIKHLTWAGLAVFLIGGCGKSDPRQQKLVGTWKQSDGEIVTFKNDGTFAEDMDTKNLKIPNIPPLVHVAGSWHISGNSIVVTIDQSTWKSDKLVGKDVGEHILSISDNEFATTSETGKENDYTRVK